MKAADVKVSVVMPVFNTAGYVADALASVMNQTLRPIEIIVIDDGSTDDSLRIVRELAAGDERVSVTTRPNRGTAATRNEGICRARGEFVYFMDSDDLLREDALEKCYKKSKRLELDLLFFDADILDDEGVGLRLGYDYHRTAGLDDRVYDGFEALGTLSRSGKYRTAIWLNFMSLEFLNRNDIRFHEGIIHEDELFTTMLFVHAARVGLIPEAFFVRRVRAGSVMTSRFTERNLHAYITIAGELKAMGEKLPVEKRAVLDDLAGRMAAAVAYRARVMPWSGRRKALAFCARYPKHTSVKDLVMLLLPKIG